VDDALDHNADLADKIVSLGLASFGLEENPQKDSILDWRGKATTEDISKAHSTIRQFYRDWSEEGFENEVKPLLDIILSDLIKYLPSPTIPDSRSPDLLLPGAGLGRLLFSLILHGYNTTGNEISYHQLLASNFVLNATSHANQFEIYPFVHTFTNIISRTQQLAKYTIPNPHPSEALALAQQQGKRVGEMSMSAGDFILSYSTPSSAETFDGVVSVFFIDTAPNLFRYIETVHNCLRRNGIWINIGPLLWHFDDRAPGQPQTDGNESSGYLKNIDMEDQGIAEPGSFELANEEVLSLLPKMGFEVLEHEILDKELGYIQDPRSLLQNRYRCSHWVARKI
jgi:carnosine N-methyltransferase